MASTHGICRACQRTFRLAASASIEKARCPGCGGALEPVTTTAAESASSSTTAPAVPEKAEKTERTEKTEKARPSSARTAERARSERTRSDETRGPGSARPARHTRAHEKEQPAKKSPLPLVLGGAGAIVVSIAVWYFASDSSSEAPTTRAAELSAIDLSKLPDKTPLEGTNDEEWAAINELVTRYRTPPFGPNSVHAGDLLMNKGRKVVPAILNGMKRLDLTKPDEVAIGLKMQTLLLQGLCNDTNFGWRRETRPEDVAYNQEIVQRWFKAWDAAQLDDARWAEIARTKSVPASFATASSSGETAEK